MSGHYSMGSVFAFVTATPIGSLIPASIGAALGTIVSRVGSTSSHKGATSIVEHAGSSADMTCVRTRSLPILAEAEETRSSRG